MIFNQQRRVGYRKIKNRRRITTFRPIDSGAGNEAGQIRFLTPEKIMQKKILIVAAIIFSLALGGCAGGGYYGGGYDGGMTTGHSH